MITLSTLDIKYCGCWLHYCCEPCRHLTSPTPPHRSPCEWHICLKIISVLVHGHSPARGAACTAALHPAIHNIYNIYSYGRFGRLRSSLIITSILLWIHNMYLENSTSTISWWKVSTNHFTLHNPIRHLQTGTDIQTCCLHPKLGHLSTIFSSMWRRHV